MSSVSRGSCSSIAGREFGFQLFLEQILSGTILSCMKLGKISVYSVRFEKTSCSWWSSTSDCVPFFFFLSPCCYSGPFRGFMRSCYHESCDDLSILTEKNLKFLELQVEVLTDTVLDIGHGLCKSKCDTIHSSIHIESSFLFLSVHHHCLLSACWHLFHISFSSFTWFDC